jgi:hypothetical protein
MGGSGQTPGFRVAWELRIHHLLAATRKGAANPHRWRDAVFKREIKCSDCEYVGAERMTLPGIALWVASLLLFVLSFVFWPLFLVWPFLIIFLLVYPVGQVCPKCDEHGRGTA